MNATIVLADGRTLSYREFGDPGGFPILSCHGGLVCGLDIGPADGAARRLGVRIVSPDRPGIGASSPQPGRDLAGWALDAQALVTALGLERFSVLGWSMGGPYALATAWALPAQVAATGLIAGCLPLADEATLAELNAMDRRLTALAADHPQEAEAAFQALAGVARHAPRAYNTMSGRGLAAADAAAIAGLPEPGLAGMAAPALESAAGLVEEYRAWVRPWGFELADLGGRVSLWQGDQDTLVPPGWAERMARQLPRATLHRVPGAGHFLAYAHYPEILEDLAEHR
jgi:pimeloyl-ACP methyl ester carboxylesterase